MQVLVVLAHPNEDSFSHALAHRACEALRAAGHGVNLLDLYALGFRAAMSADEREAYHSDEPMLDPMVAEHAALVQAADALVLVYPTWWSAQPAILKGWFERVFVPGVGFKFNAKGKVRPGLGNLRHLVGISTYGSPWGYVKAINDNGRRTLTRTVRMSAGRSARTKWLGLYAIDTATAQDRARFLDKVDATMRAL
ncbi:MAG: NAD(P)H-dependent oxidoreductase [Actinobacteria bacterium]|nr:NAD(P)H-dependent oxidoreductase [Actinomycetota bacterium]